MSNSKSKTGEENKWHHRSQKKKSSRTRFHEEGMPEEQEKNKE